MGPVIARAKYGQCEGDCTVDCGACKGNLLTAHVSDVGGSEGVWVFVGEALNKFSSPHALFDTRQEAEAFVTEFNRKQCMRGGA